MAGYLSPSDIDSVGDDDISQILWLSTNQSQQEKLALQQKLAGALRNKSTDRGQSVPTGSVFIPPNPFNTALDTFDHLQGIVDSAQGKQEGVALDSARQKALERFAKMWFNRNKGGGVAAPGDNSTPSTDPNNDLQGLM